MTLMLATVTGPEEAAIAVSAGVDIVDFAGVEAPFAAPDLTALAGMVRAVAGRRRVSAGAGTLPAYRGPAIEAVRAVAATGVDSVLVPALDTSFQALGGIAGEIRLIAVLFADRGAELSVIDLLADAGFAGAILDIADPANGGLFDHATPAKLASFIALCRERGLAGGFAGGLEAPDVPRLLALNPHVLGFRGALCHGHDRRAGLDPGAIAAIRRLIPAHGSSPIEAPSTTETAQGASQVDRVFVRDLVLQMSIGAYARERGRPQAVRFNVIAEVPALSGADDIGNVFSYDVILDTIRALAENRHVNLVETLAEEIATRLLEHGPVAAVTVKVEKLDAAPAVVGVEIVRRKR